MNDLAPAPSSLSLIDDPRVSRALRLSMWDGVFATLMLGVTETFGVPAAVSLAAPALGIALLGSLPLCLGSLGQLWISWHARPETARRRPVLICVGTQSVLLLVCALAGIGGPRLAPWLFLAAFVGFGISGNLTSMFWISWMRDLTPLRSRGRIFAARNRVLVVVQLASAVGLGLIARHYTSASVPWSFFLAAFLMAGVARAFSGLMLGLQYEPPRSVSPAPLRSVHARPDFVRFCVASALMQGATAISGPFFNVWYLTELNFDYLTFALCGASTLLGSFLFLPLWGRVADRIGSFRLLMLGALLVAVVPIPYLFVSSARAIWALNFYSGIAWSAYNLANFNTLLEATGGHRHAEREIAVSLAGVGVAVFACGLLGGVLATHAPPIAGSHLRSLFLVSAATRIGVVLFSFRTLRPLAPLPASSALEAFNELPGYRAGMGVLRTAFRAFRRQ